MDNLGDWLYIVLLVIAGISGLLSSARKKKQPEKETERLPDADDAPESEYWDWEMPTEPQYVETEKTEQTPPPKPPAYIPLFKEEEVKLPEESFHGKPLALSGEDFKNVDELKKAIIYSEILNRKY
jgi:hypothetical protein